MEARQEQIPTTQLSTDQMDQVAFYLGYPNKILVDNSTNFNRIFSQRMMNITQGTAKRVSKLLGLISDARASLDESKESAHVQNVDDVSLDSNTAAQTHPTPVSYTHLTLPTICSV